MARFYKIKINGGWLTEDGSENDLPCKLSVSGVSKLLNTFSGNTVQAIDGTPITQIFETETRGKILEIIVLWLYAPVWNSVVDLINTALAEPATMNIVGTGDIGNFDVDCVPLLPKPFEASEFINGRIKDATFRFMTT